MELSKKNKSCVRHVKGTCFAMLLYIPAKGQIKENKQKVVQNSRKR